MKVHRLGSKPAGRLVLAALVLALAACGQEGGPPQEAQAPRVQTVTVQPQSFTLASELPGRIEPVRVAEVRARVAGIVLKRNFEEGADVKAGQVLFQIDPAPFKAALSRAQGELAQAEATLFDAQAVVRRNEPLVKIEAVSRQEFDAAVARYKSAQAARQSARAGVETAQLNLDYATVTAPISGRIGRALVTEGALVGQNEATPMATIQQLDPVYADFKQPIAEVLRMREALAEGRLAQDKDKGARISITIDGTDKTRDGHLLFSDITVDRGTGQVSLRGQFDNADGMLMPGMYVRVHTQQGTDPQAILVPQRAVQRAPDGKAQVMVVDGEGAAQAREVVTGTMRGADWHIVQGLKAGEQVIVGGNAQPGQKVEVAAPAAGGDAPKQAATAAPRG
ncbi:efflux transporter periplasmic adaptor subunit [Bordetella genomosp. 5]|uniref:Efflux transporter periplasmic adaptor subunit n=1 Tax=Bordetella genomosp. 5 TaxID=1395608 RepID=A0A261T3H6_9BORD|nr:efflux RND transporter periplasmic adaptor subunit [Bordetella genomosp. 5]OZI38850.1 efflux transporter periplasmic adaptor subunit [Bordetella genomosp. 5]OZI44164.1 efflux transporter periplasmic adaptor subunit [Bordetella genomosp. 5]